MLVYSRCPSGRLVHVKGSAGAGACQLTMIGDLVIQLRVSAGLHLFSETLGAIVPERQSLFIYLLSRCATPEASEQERSLRRGFFRSLGR